MSVFNYSSRIITSKTVYSNAFSMFELCNYCTQPLNTESIFELTSKI